MKQSTIIDGKDVPVVSTEFKSSLVLATDAKIDHLYFRGGEGANNTLRKYTETDNPFAQGGVARALLFSFHSNDFSQVDLSAPNHSYATLTELTRFVHMMELTVKYGDSPLIENRKLENFMTLPILVKPYMASGAYPANTPVAAKLEWPERTPVYKQPNGGKSMSGVIPIGQDGRGLALNDDTALEIRLHAQSDSGYQVTANLNNLIVCCQVIGPRYSPSGLMRSTEAV